MIFSGLLFTPHILFDLSISKFARIYTCNIVSWIVNLFFSYGNCLDILMNLERALSFSNKYHKIKQISPYLICFIVLILSIIIHIPSNLSGTYTPDDQLYITLRLCYATSFASSPNTRIILIISYIIEGPVLIILAIVSNILAYASYKSFMKRKEQLRNNNNNNNNDNELTENEKRKIEKNEKMNKKMLVMTICLTIFSIISHIIQFGTQLIAFVLSAYFSFSHLAWARFIFSFIIIFKHFFTIFFYYYFNLNFKLMISSIICKKDTSTSSTNNNIPITAIQNH